MTLGPLSFGSVKKRLKKLLSDANMVGEERYHPDDDEGKEVEENEPEGDSFLDARGQVMEPGKMQVGWVRSST